MVRIHERPPDINKDNIGRWCNWQHTSLLNVFVKEYLGKLLIGVRIPNGLPYSVIKKIMACSLEAERVTVEVNVNGVDQFEPDIFKSNH